MSTDFRESASVDGVWTIGFQTPRGHREVDLTLSASGGVLTGDFDGAPLNDGTVDGDQITFSAQLAKPFRVKIKATAQIAGDTISGKAKAAVMTIPFRGTRRQDVAQS